MNLKYVIDPIATEILKKELTKERFLRNTNKGKNEIYVVNQHNSPNVVQEIGRLREITFATAGGGTGQAVDLDEMDLSENCYEQLIVWSPEYQEIIGGYRFIDCSLVYRLEPLPLSTHHYFHFSKKFIEKYLPKTIELGRSWIQPNFQATSENRKGMFALDNLWDGLGALTIKYQHIDYFFGKVTMYPSYNKVARNAVLSFLHYYFPDKKQLLQPKQPLYIDLNDNEFYNKLKNLNFKEGYKLLSAEVKKYNVTIPPLINSYMNLSPTMKFFGTALNPDFGNVEESGILIKINDIYPEKKERYQRID